MCIFSDAIIFPIIQIGLFALVVYAIRGEWKMDTWIKRSEKSFQILLTAYGALSAIFMFIISISDFGKGYKVIITITDLSLLLYMVFFNSWFRNKTIGFYVASITKLEGPNGRNNQIGLSHVTKQIT